MGSTSVRRRLPPATTSTIAGGSWIRAAGRPAHGGEWHRHVEQRLLLRLRQRRDEQPTTTATRPRAGRGLLRQAVLVHAVHKLGPLGPGRHGERAVRRRQRQLVRQHRHQRRVRDGPAQEQRHDDLRAEGRQCRLGRPDHLVQRGAADHVRLRTDAPRKGAHHPRHRRRQQRQRRRRGRSSRAIGGVRTARPTRPTTRCRPTSSPSATRCRATRRPGSPTKRPGTAAPRAWTTTAPAAQSGNKVQMWVCDGNAGAQNWTMASNGTIQIDGGCLDMPAGKSTAQQRDAARVVDLQRRHQPGRWAAHPRPAGQPGVRQGCTWTTRAPTPPNGTPARSCTPATAAPISGGRCPDRQSTLIVSGSRSSALLTIQG